MLVIGAGPAGLSAATGLSSRGVQFLLVESGDIMPQRDRYISCGVPELADLIA